MQTIMRPYLAQLEQMTDELNATENRRGKVLTYMNEAPFICFMKSSDTGRYEFMNRHGLELLGLREDQVIGRTDLELFPEELARVMVTHDLTLLKTRESFAAIESRTYGKRTALWLVSKFLVQNGTESIGGIAVEVPDTLRLEPLPRK